MELHSVTPQFSAPPPPPPSAAAVAPRSEVQTFLPPSATVQSVDNRKDLNLRTGTSTDDSKRERTVRQAAVHIKEQYFAVSDTVFSIYKDVTTGEFVTRFTSLRDGKVTYFPEPDILAFMERKRAERHAQDQALLDIQA